MKVYGIGGLGVDERVFSELNLNFEITPLKWIIPKTDETIANYAARLSEQIDTSKPFIIIGVSFGGMVALEINKLLNPDKIILISSAAFKTEIPIIFRVIGKAGLINLIPNFLLKPPGFVANYFFGVSEPKYKIMLHEILLDTDSNFLRWAANQIANWNNNEKPNNMIRIHGSSDRLLGFQNKKCVRLILSGGHFMIMNRAKEISQILNHEIPHNKN